MSYYKVKYLNSDAKRVKAYFEFDSIKELNDFLIREKIQVLSIQKVAKALANFEKLFAPKITANEIIEFINHLSIVVKSGLPLYQSVEDLALESQNSSFKKMLFTISTNIKNGNTLSHSLSEYSNVFGFATIYLIRIGEETGTLDQTLQKAKNFLIQSYQYKRDFKMALIYPLIILSVATIAVIMWFTFVLPQMTEMFLQMDIELPPFTKFLIWMSDIITASLPYIFVLLSISGIVIWMLNKNSRRMHYYFTEKLINFPLLGPLIKEINTAYITEFLYQSTSTGTSLFKALKIITANIPNVVFKQSLKNTQKSLERGDSLSVSLQKEKLYNAFTIRMLNIGEKSGDLDSQLYTISQYYEERFRHKIVNITKVLEPALIIFLGLLFVLIIVGLMGPIFDIIATI
jgi:type II secretory pathway component PulF